MNVQQLVECLLSEGAAERMLHVSFRGDLDKKVIVPKLPDSVLEYLDDLEKNPNIRNDLEETRTPRFCMAPTIAGCLNALSHLVRLLDKYPHLTFYVYTNAAPVGKHYDWRYLDSQKLVFDAYLTKEMWVLEPIQLKKIGKFNLSKANIDSRVGKISVLPFNAPTKSGYVCPMFHYRFKNLPEFAS